MRGRGSERGSILLLVVWIVAVLAVIAAMLSIRTKVFIRNSAYINGRTSGSLVLEGGIQRALFDILTLPARRDVPPEEQNPIRFDYTINGEMIRVQKLSDAGKLSIHTVRQDVWKEIFMTYGKTEEEALEIVSSIMDWTDKDALLHPGGAEDDYYRDQPFPYYPDNDKMGDLRELLLIKGIDDEMVFGSERYPALTEFFTVRKGGTRLDLNSASRLVIQAMTGATDDEMDALLEARREKPFQTIHDVNPFLGPEAFQLATQYFTTEKTADIITLRATLNRGRQTIALEEVFQLNGRTIKWLERREWTY